MAVRRIQTTEHSARDRHRVAAVAEIGYGVPGLDQRRRKELAQGFVVFRQKDMRHVARLPVGIKAYTRQSCKLWLTRH